MIVGIVGGRDFSNKRLVGSAILCWGSNPLGFGEIDGVVTGDARGADSLAIEVCTEMGIPVKSHVAHWDKYGQDAGAIRNRHVVAEADALVAFWDYKSPGTQDAINHAISLGKEVFIVRYGKIEESCLERPSVTNRAKEHDVYIGRPSKYGNPYSSKESSLARQSTASLSESLDRFELEMRMLPLDTLAEWSKELKGKRLGCWCHNSSCHGTVIANVLEEMFPHTDSVRRSGPSETLILGSLED